MKKFLALALTAAMAISMVACSSAPASSESTEEPALTYKTGMGTVISVSPSNESVDDEKGASAQVNTSIVVATFDSNDTIVSVTIDVAQQKAAFDLEGQPSGEVDLRTKIEKQGDYGMLKASSIGKEYFEQIDALEAWMTGKTLNEVMTMPTYERDASHTACPDVEDLKASCTITVGDYLKALQKAYDNAVECAGVPAKTGLGTEISATVKGEDVETETGASVQINTNMIAVAVDAEGKIVAAQLDVAQQKVAFDLDGVAGETDLRTKVEKKADYGMLKASAIGKEYYEQSKAFTDWMVGQTVAEVVAMPTYERDASHTACPDVEDLKASVSITVGDYLKALAEAEKNAK